MLRCKFKVSGVEKSEDGESRTLRMEACIDESGDNENWSKWTPSGQFSISVTNPDAFEEIDSMNEGDVHFLTLSDVL